MKKIISYLMIAVFTFTAVLAKASDINVDINNANNEMVTITVNNDNLREAISIMDVNGTVLYYTNNLPEGTVKNLDFSSVPDGQYFIKIETGNTTKAISIIKNLHDLNISAEKDLLLKPTFVKRNDNKVNVFYNNEQLATVSLNIYDNNDNLVQTISGNDLQFQKTLDFSKVPRGTYTITFVSPLLRQPCSTTFETK
ncbi:MAG TPA: T9SS type A sorting domain-containing protein [Arachidicoccus soli]|nr:T9SS type A sorting domain-containing protein [Arachidicoccus soli]